MATLDANEQAKVDRYEELRMAKRDGIRYVNDADLANAKQLAEYAERNAEAREHFEAQRAAEQKVIDDQTQARINAAAKEASDTFLRGARGRYAGTDAEFAADAPEILRQWRIQSALNTQDNTMERKRQMLSDIF